MRFNRRHSLALQSQPAGCSLRTMKPLSIALLLLLGCAQLPAQDPEVRKIRERFEAAKPSPEKLAIFSLDWAPSLTEAKARARKEGRPIFFIWLSNISASTNFFGGHC
jgi:hypothetical protein